MDLSRVFDEVNRRHFDGFLDEPELCWNKRLRTVAGRFTPGSRKGWFLEGSRPKIELAQYLLEETDAAELVRDTLAHEMIHYWLWVRRRPYGHGEEFLRKMREMGVSRYNTVARTRPHKYVYRCVQCGNEVRARRKLGEHACLHCCREHSGGRYDKRFRLVFARRLEN